MTSNTMTTVLILWALGLVCFCLAAYGIAKFVADLRKGVTRAYLLTLSLGIIAGWTSGGIFVGIGVSGGEAMFFAGLLGIAVEVVSLAAISESKVLEAVR